MSQDKTEQKSPLEIAVEHWKVANNYLEQGNVDGYLIAIHELHEIKIQYDIKEADLRVALKNEIISPKAGSILNQLNAVLSSYSRATVTDDDKESIEASYVSGLNKLSSFFMSCKMDENERIQRDRTFTPEYGAILTSILKRIHDIANPEVRISGNLFKEIISYKIHQATQLKEKNPEGSSEYYSELFSNKDIKKLSTDIALLNKKNETPAAQAKRIFDNLKQQLAAKPGYPIGLIYSANDNQVQAFDKAYQENPDNPFENFHTLDRGRGQAKLFKELIKLIHEERINNPDIVKQIKILPFATSLRGGENKEGNTVTKEQMERDLGRIQQFIKDGGKVRGIPDSARGGYAIGGAISANWFTQKHVGVTYEGKSLSQGEFVQKVLKQWESNPFQDIGDFKLNEGLHYMHTPKKPDDMGRFHLFKVEYENLKGDAAKSKILAEFKDELQSCNNEQEIDDKYREFLNSDNYKILAKSTGLVTAALIKLKLGETDSVKAVRDMVQEAKDSLQPNNQL